MRLFTISCAVILFGVSFGTTFAQELVLDTSETVKARVVEVVSEEEQIIPGTNTLADTQVIRALILEGEEEGKIVTIDNDYLMLREDEQFFLRHTKDELNGIDSYMVSEPYRLSALAFLAALFIGVVLVFGGKQGIRGLLSLLMSLVFIVFLLLPGILQGFSPVLVAVAVSSLIICLGSYVTHGFNKTTTTAVLGMVATISLTGVLAHVAIIFTRLSGFSSDESIYLNFNTGGEIDIAGILLGGVLIGILGVLYDAAIGQSISVEELAAAGPDLPRRTIFARALRIGREHVGALVNTLAIAYVGVSLPLLLLFYGFGSESIFIAVNREIFATEIVRTLVGSIGIVLTVPITTFIAVRLLVKNRTER